MLMKKAKKSFQVLFLRRYIANVTRHSHDKTKSEKSRFPNPLSCRLGNLTCLNLHVVCPNNQSCDIKVIFHNLLGAVLSKSDDGSVKF